MQEFEKVARERLFGLIINELHRRGWIVETGNADILVPALPKVGQRLGCGDGRRLDVGPKFLGGVWGMVASSTYIGAGIDWRSNTRIATIGAVGNAARWMYQAGFIPTVHGDGYAGAAGCAFFKLWRERKLPTVNTFGLKDSEVGVITSGQLPPIVSETITGRHKEERFDVNLRPWSTFKPDVSSFKTDLWVAPSFFIDPLYLLDMSLTVIENLSSVRTTRLFT